MPRTPHDNELIRAARREEIFRAAGRVFAKKGFAATKIADIAAEAKLSHGLLYHYFRSKEDVYAGLVAEILRQWSALAEIAAGSGSPLERLRGLVGRLLERSAERPELAVLVTQALVGETLPSATRQQLLRHGRATYDHVVDLVRQAQRVREAASDERAEELGLAIMSMIRGLGTMRFFARSALDARAPLPAVSVDTVLRVLRPAPAEGPRDAARAAPPPTKRPTRRRPPKERRRAA